MKVFPADLVCITDSASLPGSPSDYLLKRWIYGGSMGVKLPGVFSGHKWYVSLAAYEKWCAEVSAAHKLSKLDKVAIRRAARRLLKEELYPVFVKKPEEADKAATAVGAKLNIPIGRYQLYSWCRNGLKKGSTRVFLDYVYIGHIRYTSAEAVMRLLREMQ
jgi:hypothetical protein